MNNGFSCLTSTNASTLADVTLCVANMTVVVKFVLFSIVVVCAPLVLSDIVFPGPTDKADEAEGDEVSK